MNDKELLDMFADERIDMHLQKLIPKEKYHKKEMSKAETFIKNLSIDDKELIENFIQESVEIFVEHETYLYKCGFCDGIKVMKSLLKL